VLPGTDTTVAACENRRMTAMYDMPVRVSTKGDARWQQWIARGEAQDRARQQRARRIAIFVGSTILLWLSATWTLR
jgi:hypothetical protein